MQTYDLDLILYFINLTSMSSFEFIPSSDTLTYILPVAFRFFRPSSFYFPSIPSAELLFSAAAQLAQINRNTTKRKQSRKKKNPLETTFAIRFYGRGKLNMAKCAWPKKRPAQTWSKQQTRLADWLCPTFPSHETRKKITFLFNVFFFFFVFFSTSGFDFLRYIWQVCH